MDFFRDFDFAYPFSRAVGGAAIGFHLHAVYRQCTHAQRVPERRSKDFEVVNALGIRLLVDAVERGDPFVLEIVRDALVRR